MAIATATVNEKSLEAGGIKSDPTGLSHLRRHVLHTLHSSIFFSLLKAWSAPENPVVKTAACDWFQREE